MQTPDNFIQPISIIIPLKDIGERGITRSFSLDEKDRAILASELELSDFSSFTCNWQLKGKHKNRYLLTGEIIASYIQQSAVTLEPLECEMNEQFSTEYWPVSQNDLQKSPELEIEYADEIIEFYEDEKLNIGQIIYEHFVIAIDQFPKREDEELDWQEGDNADNEKPNPFAVLKKLKDQ